VFFFKYLHEFETEFDNNLDFDPVVDSWREKNRPLATLPLGLSLKNNGYETFLLKEPCTGVEIQQSQRSFKTA
jgi:hypothetical protein